MLSCRHLLRFTKTVLQKLPTLELGVILGIFELFLLSILLICPTYPTVDLNWWWWKKNLFAQSRHIKPHRAKGRSKRRGKTLREKKVPTHLL